MKKTINESLRLILKPSEKVLKMAVFFLAFALMHYTARAQTEVISGKVINAAGEAVSGVSVNVKGSSVGTSTDISGNFSISAAKTDVLEISSVGFISQDVAVAGRSSISITLQRGVNTLNDVVVVGYTTQKKKDLTGAVSTVSSRDINAIPVGGVDQILQGKAAGVTITQSTGAPGEGVTVRVRGTGTINNNDPLYIVDGVPTKDGINEISPNDIETISVLKDAASASIYGARASNGVIVITTKKGRAGKPRLSLNFYAGSQTPANLIKMANTDQYIQAYNIAATNDGRPLIPLSARDTLSNTNWQKEVLNSAPILNAQLSLSGGNENTRYIVSGAYFSQKGMIDNSSTDRFNLRTSLTSTINKIFKVGTNVNISTGNTKQVSSSGDGFASGQGGSILRYALFATPASGVRFPTGAYAGQYVDRPYTLPIGPGGSQVNVFGDGLNPVGLAANADRNFKNYSLLGDAYVEVTPIAHLKLKSDFGTNFIITDFKQFKNTWGTDRPGGHIENSPNALSQYNLNNYNYNWTNTATYDWTINKHALNFLAGTEIIYNETKLISASNSNFPNQSPAFQYLNNGTSISPSVGGDLYNSSLSSVFGRVDYQYDAKYLASFSVRRDGSSRLDPSNRWGNFYSGSVGWRIDKEKFMANIKPVSLLKLRASLGQLGNQEISNYGYASLLGANGYYAFGNTATPTYSIYAKGNPNVKWETSTIADIGLDLGLFNDALSFTADYYHKKTSDLLVAPPNPTSAGTVAGAAYENNGEILNTGFEFDLSYRKQINKDWRFEVGANLATVHNEVLSLLNSQPIPGGQLGNGGQYITSTAVGHPIGEFYILQQEGVFQNALDVFTHANQGANIVPGDIKFKDVNGDGKIDQNDRVYAGSPIPKLNYGFTGNVAFKQFDLNIFFQGVSGNKIYNQVGRDIEGFYRPFNLTVRALENAWSGEGSTNKYARLSYTGGQNNTQASTRFLEDGSYLRLKNVQIGYSFSSALINRLKVSSMRLFVSGQNLLTFTKYSGLDPEMATSADAAAQGDGVKGVGIDWGTYPSARTFTAGVNINF